MIPSKKPQYPLSVASRAIGHLNEDRYALQHYALSEANPKPSLLTMVTDGIGASRAGQVAAQLAVDAVTRLVGQSDASQPSGILQAAIIQASRLILQRSETRREWKGMGSTCLCAWLVGDRLYAASVGNARLYLMRGERLQQLNLPRLPEKNAPAPRKDADGLHGYLGAKTPLDVDLRLYPASGGRPSLRQQGMRLRPNDRLLLCTSGLGDGLQPEEIGETLAASPIEDAAEALVQRGLKTGLPGDLTAIVIGMPPAIPPLQARRSQRRRRLWRAGLVALLVLLALLAWQGQPDTPDLLGPSSPTAIHTLTPLPTHTPSR